MKCTAQGSISANSTNRRKLKESNENRPDRSSFHIDSPEDVRRHRTLCCAPRGRSPKERDRRGGIRQRRIIGESRSEISLSKVAVAPPGRDICKHEGH